jgi:hypothetical protein
MTTFSEHFQLGKSQAELDFVDIPLDGDLPLFIDPFAISQRSDRWSQSSHTDLTSFFHDVIDSIREGRDDQARHLLSFLREPNETHLGLSSGRPQGAGIGSYQAGQLLEALRESEAVQTGFLSSLEECELMIDGIGWDKISDLTTNIIRGRLAEYSLNQCRLHEIPVRSVNCGAWYEMESHDWITDYLELPVVNGYPILLVPKSVARYKLAYDHQQYYHGFALEFLQAQHLDAGSNLVHSLKNGKRKVYKKDLEAQYPCTKAYLFRFSKEHPEVLAKYREQLRRLERSDLRFVVKDTDERVLAGALRAALSSIATGGNDASEYHKLMIGILEFILFPNLVGPRKEQEIHQGRKRIDILMENAASEGVFNRLHSTRNLPSAFVAFECKNYTTDIANPELDQIAGRFSPNRGKIGFVCCRQFEDKARFIERCRDTLRDDRGLVVPVDDLTINTWLAVIEAGKRRELDVHLTRAVDEVWVS